MFSFVFPYTSLSLLSHRLDSLQGVVFYQTLEVTDEYGKQHSFDLRDRTQGALVSALHKGITHKTAKSADGRMQFTHLEYVCCRYTTRIWTMVIEAKPTVAWRTATPCLVMVACGSNMGTLMTGDALCHRQQSEPYPTKQQCCTWFVSIYSTCQYCHFSVLSKPDA